MINKYRKIVLIRRDNMFLPSLGSDTTTETKNTPLNKGHEYNQEGYYKGASYSASVVTPGE